MLRTSSSLSKSCVLNVYTLRVLGTTFQGLSEVEQVHVSLRLSPRLRCIRVGVYG